MFGIVRRWLQKKFSLPSPETIAVQSSLASSSWSGKGPPLATARVVLPRVPKVSGNCVRLHRIPRTDSVELLLPLDSVSISCPLLAPSSAPSARILEFQLRLPYPDIFDMFTGLLYPARLGKAYDQDRSQPSVERAPSYKPSLSPDLEERCRHGLPRYMCDVCSGEDTKGRFYRSDYQRPNAYSRTGPTVPVYDVFDLLLPYLQPPLEVFLGNLTLFPEGRRPYPYQVDGILFLTEHRAALLGDEMGLGKTIQAILALRLLVQRMKIRRALIVCRRSLLSVWETELHRWAPELYVTKVRGNREFRERLWRLSNSVLFLTTYGTLSKDMERFPKLLAHRFDAVILDEIQEIKNPRTAKARSARQLDAPYRWGLSGTPLENRLEDIIAIFDFLEPSLFQRVWMRNHWVVKEAIRPFLLRRRTKDVLSDLPDKITTEIWLELSPRQRKAYEREFDRAREQLSEREATRIHVFSWINRLKQLCNLHVESGESCKLEYLQDQLDSIIGSGQKALVFSHFPNVTLRRIEDRLSEFNPAVFDGTLNDQRREELIQAFQEKDTPSVLLMSVKTGGTGLTLTRANHVFHFDHWWNPAVANQAEGRAYRIGQKQTVFVYDIYAQDTIEERIYRLLRTKQQLFDTVVDDLSEEHIRKSITDEELFALFDLQPTRH